MGVWPAAFQAFDLELKALKACRIQPVEAYCSENPSR